MTEQEYNEKAQEIITILSPPTPICWYIMMWSFVLSFVALVIWAVK